METPNLDRLLDEVMISSVNEDALRLAYEERDALKKAIHSAQPKRVGVPTVAGFYWSRYAKDQLVPGEDNPFEMVSVYRDDDGSLRYATFDGADARVDRGYRTDWIGPLTEPTQ